METLIQQFINGLVIGSVYALIALGYTMVYGILEIGRASCRERVSSPV